MLKSNVQQIRYASRILGGIASVFYFFIAFKGGLVEVMRGLGGSSIPFFPFLAIAVAGYMIAYVNEKKGGYILLVGGIALFFFFLIYSGWEDWTRAAVYGLPFIIPALGFIYCNQREMPV